jgi:TRAP-type mannitol/chloroaromatic compound transport system permease small subunit
MRAFVRAVDHLSQFSGIAAAQLYLVCAVITTYEVVMRYLFHNPTQWAFEMVMVLCASAWMISVGYVTRNRRHIGITVLHVMAPRKVRFVLDLFADVVGLISVVILAYAAWEPMIRVFERIERSGSAFNSPQPTILKTVLVIGAVIYAVQLVANIAKLIMAGPEGDPEPQLRDEG